MVIFNSYVKLPEGIEVERSGILQQEYGFKKKGMTSAC